MTRKAFRASRRFTEFIVSGTWLLNVDALLKRHSARSVIAVTVLFVLLCHLPIIGSRPWVVMLNLATSVSMVLCGLFLRRELRQGPWCQALVVCGILWSARWIGTWDVGPFPIMSGFLYLAIFTVGGSAMLIAPKAQITKLDHLLVNWFWLGLPFVQIALISTSKPEWVSFETSVWWITAYADPRLFHNVGSVVMVMETAAAVAFAIALINRLRNMSGLDRRISLPIYLVAGTLGGISSGSNEYELLAMPDADQMYQVITCAWIALSLGFIGAALVRRLLQAAIAQTLHQAFSDGRFSIASVESALIETLRDPTLRLYVWDKNTGRYYDGTTSITSSATLEKGRVLKELRAPDGSCVALMDMDVALENHPSVVNMASQATAVAIQNISLQGDLEQRLIELQHSRARLAKAELEERRRIQRDLHDGVQQRLLAVIAKLGVLQRESDPEKSKELVQHLNTEVREALEELRDLANGIHPQVLRQFGLTAALDEVIDRLPLQASLNIPDVHLSPDHEATIYFVTCEALANVLKHANATSVAVNGRVENNIFEIEVVDDGDGGADFSKGSGLTGCYDRLASVGGTLDILDPHKGGTMLRAQIPITSTGVNDADGNESNTKSIEGSA